MSTITRIHSSTYFHDTYGNGSDVWDEVDDMLNLLVSTVNALDNANIANTPKIAGDKIDFSLGGFVEDSGDEMTGPLEHVFDGIFRKMRASGNARLYEGTADVLWALSYNTEYSGGAWQGRDATGICLKITLEGDGFHIYGAVSASAATVPSWTEIFHVDDETGLNAKITPVMLSDMAAGSYRLSLNATSRTEGVNSSTWTKIKQSKLYAGGAYRIVFTAGGTSLLEAKIYRNGVAVGTLRTLPDAGPHTYSEDISGWTSGDLVQIYGRTSGSNRNMDVSDLDIRAAAPHTAAFDPDNY